MEQRILTEKQAYAAMLLYLEDYYARDKSDEVAILLSGMRFLRDGLPADPFAWNDWRRSVRAVLTAAQTPEAWAHFEDERLIASLTNPDYTAESQEKAGSTGTEDKALNYDNFVSELLRVAPEVRPVYDEHMRENDGELLPHVFMGAVTRFVCEAYERANSANEDADYWQQVLARILSLLEIAVASPNIMLVNLITVSFLENLIPSDKQQIEAYHGLKALLGPALRKQMTAILEYWGFSDSNP